MPAGFLHQVAPLNLKLTKSTIEMIIFPAQLTSSVSLMLMTAFLFIWVQNPFAHHHCPHPVSYKSNQFRFCHITVISTLSPHPFSFPPISNYYLILPTLVYTVCRNAHWKNEWVNLPHNAFAHLCNFIILKCSCITLPIFFMIQLKCSIPHEVFPKRQISDFCQSGSLVANIVANFGYFNF